MSRNRWPGRRGRNATQSNAVCGCATAGTESVPLYSHRMGMGSSRPLPPDDSGLDLVPARGGGGADASVRSIHHVHSKDLKTFALDLLTTAFASALMYFITKKTIAQMDPTRNSKKVTCRNLMTLLVNEDLED